MDRFTLMRIGTSEARSPLYAPEIALRRSLGQPLSHYHKGVLGLYMIALGIMILAGVRGERAHR